MNRLLSILIIEQEKQHEWNTICTMAKNNVSPLRLIHILKHKISKTQLTSHKPTSATQKKWITFTYHSPHVYKATNLFRNTNVQIAFQTSNTIFHQLRHRPPHNQQKASGIYRLQCNTCSKSYTDQTGQSVATRYREHTRYIKTNNPPIRLRNTYL